MAEDGRKEDKRNRALVCMRRRSPIYVQCHVGTVFAGTWSTFHHADFGLEEGVRVRFQKFMAD